MTERDWLSWPGTLRQWGTEPAQTWPVRALSRAQGNYGSFYSSLQASSFCEELLQLVWISLSQGEVIFPRKLHVGSVCVLINRLLKEWMLRKALGKQRWEEHSPCHRGVHSPVGSAQSQTQKLRYRASKGLWELEKGCLWWGRSSP